MKTIYTAFLILFTSHFVSAQAGEWVWLRGSSTTGDPGNYGTLGMPSATNDPPAIYEPCEFTDAAGSFWFYGGMSVSGGAYNNLWKYDPIANEWTWMTGTNALDDSGSFGTMGVPDSANRPPSFGYGADSWVDLNGDFWIFGGAINGGSYGALWRYSVSTNLWTWMKGPNQRNKPGVNGAEGVPDTANTPVYRSESATAWTDSAGDLWFFGGNFRNDMWRYNIATNTWTWMNGDTIYYGAAQYGSPGVEAVGNTPSGRYSYARWKDTKGYLWLYSGGRPSYFDQMGDLWRFNPVNNEWAWMNGSNTNCGGLYPDVLPTWGTQCITSSGNNPSCRWENRAAWTDANGNFWTFGGAYGDEFQYAFNDLWMYCVSSNQWTWMSGNNYVNPGGNWGTMGTPDPNNVPDGRAGSVGWTDKKGHLYIFGGAFESGYSLLRYNDLWMFTIDPACGTCAAVAVPPVASFQANDTMICANGCINFTDLSANATSWQWNFSGAIDSTSTSQNPQNICYRNAGIYNVTLTVSNSSGSNTLTFTNYIDVSPSPPTPVITQSNDTLYCSFDSSYTAYQWYIDSTLINGATSAFLVIAHGGNYNVQVTNKYDCKIAGGINIVLGIQNYSNDNIFSIYPNPVNKTFTVYGLQFTVARVEIYNVLGQEVLNSREFGVGSRDASHSPYSQLPTTFDVSSLPAGVYFVQIVSDSQRWTGRFVKE